MAQTVRLTSTYAGNAPGTIITVDDAIAAQLVANGNATTDQTGGVVRYQDAQIAGRGGSVKAAQRASIEIPNGQSLIVSGGVAVRGVIEKIDRAGNLLLTQRISGRTILPGPGRYRVSVDYGTATVSLDANSVAYTPAPQFDVPVRVATWGDSLTDTSNVATHDFTAATRPLFDQTDLYGSRLAFNMMFYSGGNLIPVANSGLGGSTSPQILARDTAVAGVNRRGAQDAANLGAQVCVISLGRNDILSGIRANSTPAAQQTVLAAIYANVATAVRRAQRLGMYPILREFAGYGYEDSAVNYAKNAGLTPADVAVQLALMNTAHRYIVDVIVPSLGEMTLLPIRDGMVNPATGAWYPQYTIDGLHENRNGAREVARRLISVVMSMARPYAQPGRYAPLPAGAGRLNAFVAPAMVTVAGGLASGITAGAGIGTTNRTPSVSEDGAGTVWQNLVFSATAYDNNPKVWAPNGLASAVMQMRMSIDGATPTLPVVAGDLIRVEFDLVIENAVDGGVPTNVLTWFAQVSIGYPLTQFFRVRPVEQNINSTGLYPPDEVIAGKVISLPIAMPAASADMDNGLVAVTVYVSDSTPVRVRVANLRFIKYSAAK